MLLKLGMGLFLIRVASVICMHLQSSAIPLKPIITLFTKMIILMCFKKPLLMKLCHPPDGSTSPKYKVLIHHNLFYQIQNALAFNRDMCCHLVLCLRLLPFHYQVLLGLFLIIVQLQPSFVNICSFIQ